MQFHPESVLTPQGPVLMGNFLQQRSASAEMTCMSALRETLEQLLDRRNLSEAAGGGAARRADGSDAARRRMGGALLAALRAKGVTADEVRGFAKTHAQARAAADSAGGRAAGRHGRHRRRRLRQFQSFDRRRAAGRGDGHSRREARHQLRFQSQRQRGCRCARSDLDLPLDETAAGECLAATGFTFFFAPHYHPAMKAVMPIRQALGVRTVFNILGPLSNPAEPPFHLIGAYHVDIAALMAETLAGMPIERAYVVHGEPGWDEATPIGPFTVFDVRPGKVVRYDAQRRGIRAAPLQRRRAEGRRCGLQRRASARRAGRPGTAAPIATRSSCRRRSCSNCSAKRASAQDAAQMAQDAIESGAGRATAGTNCGFRPDSSRPELDVAIMSGLLTANGAIEPGEARTGARARIRKALWARACDTPPAPPLKLSPEGFDIIAECKLHSPSAGDLSATHERHRKPRHGICAAAAHAPCPC